MDSESTDNQEVISSYEEAKEYVLNLPLRPKIPGNYGVTRYDSLAERLIEFPRVYDVEEIECRIVERIFGLDVRFEKRTALSTATAQLRGTCVLRFANAEHKHHCKVFRLLEKLWRTHGLLRLLPEYAPKLRVNYFDLHAGGPDFTTSLAVAIVNVEEAFLETTDRLDEAVVQARALLKTCPELPSPSPGTYIPRLFDSTRDVLY